MEEKFEELFKELGKQPSDIKQSDVKPAQKQKEPEADN